MKVNKTLTLLNLEGNPITAEGCNSLINSIVDFNENLVQVKGLSKYKVGTEQKEKLKNKLKLNKKKRNVSGIEETRQEIEDIRSAFRYKFLRKFPEILI